MSVIYDSDGGCRWFKLKGNCHLCLVMPYGICSLVLCHRHVFMFAQKEFSLEIIKIQHAQHASENIDGSVSERNVDPTYQKSNYKCMSLLHQPDYIIIDIIDHYL